MDGTLPKFRFLKLQGREGSNSTQGLDGGGFWDHTFEFTRTWFLSCSNMGILQRYEKYQIGSYPQILYA